ncbi:MAG: AAA family ATPase [Clostridia bacterium]|nr:AAA family ATPase [Clostridia bacterium]
MDTRVINEIMRQFRQGGRDSEWHQFLSAVRITNLHGWSGQEVIMRFPIVAIAGENGIGKSTVLKAAACAYTNQAGSTFYPAQMFVRTAWDEKAYADAEIQYEVKQGTQTKELKWTRKQRWYFSPRSRNGSGKPKRNVFFLDISRTLPLDATAGYAKIAKLATSEMGAAEVLSPEAVRDLSYVLGRKYREARFVGTDVDNERKVGLVTKNGGESGTEISQFHQGAGEHSLLSLFRLLSEVPNQSLLLIDELENSLHPQAQRRLITHLLNVCRAKKLQIILSTHSAFVLQELPPIARVMLVPLHHGLDVVYEVSPDFALSQMDEEKHPDLRIYLEDSESEAMFWEILQKDRDAMAQLTKRIETHSVGTASVVETLDRLGRENRLGFPGMGVLDADKAYASDTLTLPGSQAPEREVLGALKGKNWPGLPERFGIGAGRLFKYFDDALLLPDHHKWTAYIGDQVGMSQDVVWKILLEEWRKTCLSEEEAARLIDTVRQHLDV